MKYFITSVIFILSVGYTKATYKPQDSVGIANKNGGYFIIHEVGNRQTLFALSKVYKVSIQEILEANPGMLPAVQAGQLVYIPAKSYKPQPGVVFSVIDANGKLAKEGDEQAAEPAKEEPKKEAIPKEETKPVAPTPQPTKKTEPEPEETEETDDSPSAITSDKFDWKNYNTAEDLYHTVKNGETLYRIATFYGITVQEIMELNGLESSTISKGQKLLIKKVKKKADAPKSQPKEEKQTDKTPKKDKPVESTQNLSDEAIVTEVSETGMALVVDKNFQDADKNIALHLSAPVGTILMVSNPANGRTVYLRVVGKLETNDKDLLLMISPTAANELGAPLTGKVKLTLSYAP